MCAHTTVFVRELERSITQSTSYYEIINMLPQLFVVLLSVMLSCASALVNSSFWAPLFNGTILNYRVDVPFEPSAALSARDQYAREYGYRGEKLIADLGHGRPPGHNSKIDENQVYGDVIFYYT